MFLVAMLFDTHSVIHWPVVKLFLLIYNICFRTFVLLLSLVFLFATRGFSTLELDEIQCYDFFICHEIFYDLWRAIEWFSAFTLFRDGELKSAAIPGTCCNLRWCFWWRHGSTTWEIEIFCTFPREEHDGANYFINLISETDHTSQRFTLSSL